MGGAYIRGGDYSVRVWPGYRKEAKHKVGGANWAGAEPVNRGGAVQIEGKS